MTRRLATVLRPLLALTLPLVGCVDEAGLEEHAGSEPGVVALTEDQRRNARIESRSLSSVDRPLRVSIPGVLATPDTARVLAGSFVDGRVERVLVLEGDRVEAGAPLVRIHSHEVAEWEREATAAESTEEFAALALERSRRLLADGAVSREEVERREMELRVARADLQLAREILSHLHPEDGSVVIRSPRSATVFRILAAPGEAVVPGTPLMELGSTDVLWAVGGVPEGMAPAVGRGDPVEVSFPALGDIEGSGFVVALGAQVDATLRSVEIRVQLDPIPVGVRPGMLATLRIPVGTVETGVPVPADAVQRIRGEDHVFLEEAPGRYRAHPVVLRILEGDEALLEGVPDGARVVVRGAYTLRAVLEGFQGPEDPE